MNKIPKVTKTYIEEYEFTDDELLDFLIEALDIKFETVGAVTESAQFKARDTNYYSSHLREPTKHRLVVNRIYGDGT